MIRLAWVQAMPAYHLRRTLEHADGRCGLAFASDRLEADDAEAAIRRARDLCRTAANMLLTGAVLTDSLGRILWSFTLALAREPLCVRPTS
ncbi:hypothetical protein SAMN02799625_02931 [Methylobacterium sp. UNC300MFChir4.1]|nr:hypothetical protein SAMN02799625_02931 [Methylobacterium sp. UNC300MFChir4.1]